MPEPVEQHKALAPSSIAVAVVTISDTRTLETDRGGSLIVELLEAAGHQITARVIIPDEPDDMRQTIAQVRGTSMEDSVATAAIGATEVIGAADVILMTGGTGISSRDQTFETLSTLIEKPLPGYGELFRMLSYEEIGPAAMLSRTIGGVIGKTVVLTMPGSPNAVRLAMEKLILPELKHFVQQATR